MNAVLATNVRIFRESKHWTQHHLADAAGIQLRTVQRVEGGEGASVDTLGALASVFEVSIDFLKTDLVAVAEEFKRQEEQLHKSHYFVDVRPVTCSAHLEIIGDCDASLMHCATEDDEARDIFASLKSDLADMVDLWGDVGPNQHREWTKSAYEHVRSMNQLGLVVSVGKGNRVMRAGPGLVTFLTLHVMAWPKGSEKEVIAVPKDP